MTQQARPAPWLAELNDAQLRAVVYTDGPQLVVAGAGSGKTRVLTCKVAYLLENGYEPWHILALTFTNKAAREMKERIARQVGIERARRLWMGTFHSMFLRILFAEADRIGFTSHFTIYDKDDSKSLLRTILKELQLDEKLYKPATVQAIISSAKNRLIDCQAYAANAQLRKADGRRAMPAMHEVYKRYVKRCRQSDAMDFDDLLFYTYRLLRDNPDVLARYREHFHYILVDEYQDTNYAQHAIVRLLAEEHQRVCVVGDDAQSIYSFRGAEIDNMLRFAEAYPNTRVFKLEQNYRSTQTIVQAANSLIRKNEHQIHKEVYSRLEVGEPIEIYPTYSDVEEAETVVNHIARLRRSEQSAYADFAILYRTHAQSRVFEEALRRCEMPYRIYGGVSFYQRKEIKDVIAYFRLAINPHDEEALKRVINYPARGIGATTLGKLTTAASTSGVSIWTVLSQPQAGGLPLSVATVSKLAKFVVLIEDFRKQATTADAYTVGAYIIRQAGLIEELHREDTVEGIERQQNVEELLNAMRSFCEQRQTSEDMRVGLTDFLAEVSLLTDQDTDDDKSTDRVTLMTVHSAKGLEFPTVFVVGMEEGLFPSSMVEDSPREMEEERRLFYVAITRAERHCFLSLAKSRFRYGQMAFSSPSRFLRDIDSAYIRIASPQGWADSGQPYMPRWQGRRQVNSDRAKAGNERPKASYGRKIATTPNVSTPSAGLRPVSSASSSTSSSVSSASSSAGIPVLSVGGQVEHERFGRGEVLKVEGEGVNAKATIRFAEAGQKQLLLRFAKLKIIQD